MVVCVCVCVLVHAHVCSIYALRVQIWGGVCLSGCYATCAVYSSEWITRVQVPAPP